MFDLVVPPHIYNNKKAMENVYIAMGYPKKVYKKWLKEIGKKKRNTTVYEVDNKK